MKRNAWHNTGNTLIPFEEGEETIQKSIEGKFKTTFYWVKGFRDHPSLLDQVNKDMDVKYDSDLHAGVKNLVKPVHINPEDLLTTNLAGRANPFSDLLYNVHLRPNDKIQHEMTQLKDWGKTNLTSKEYAYLNYMIGVNTGTYTQADRDVLTKEFNYVDKQYPSTVLELPPEPTKTQQVLNSFDITGYKSVSGMMLASGGETAKFAHEVDEARKEADKKVADTIRSAADKAADTWDFLKKFWELLEKIGENIVPIGIAIGVLIAIKIAGDVKNLIR